MSKICDRKYEANSLYSLKQIDGVACCPSCEQPAACHGKPVMDRVAWWALVGGTGTSSKAIAKHMTGYISDDAFGFMPPSDSADRGRCIKLLELVPEWLPRLSEMCKYDTQKPQGIVISSSGISADTNTWFKQIPLIVQEGKFSA